MNCPVRTKRSGQPPRNPHCLTGRSISFPVANQKPIYNTQFAKLWNPIAEQTFGMFLVICNVGPQKFRLQLLSRKHNFRSNGVVRVEPFGCSANHLDTLRDIHGISWRQRTEVGCTTRQQAISELNKGQDKDSIFRHTRELAHYLAGCSVQGLGK